MYQAILNEEEHLLRIAHITTLSGYIHYLLTGNRELGVCEASGMFPIDGNDYNEQMLQKFEIGMEILTQNIFLGDWLDTKVFGNMQKEVLHPNSAFAKGFDKFFELYKSGLGVFYGF